MTHQKAISDKCPLEIVQFANPKGGSISYRVTGTIEGKRIQKNRKTLEEATNLRDALLKGAAQGESLPSYYRMTTFPTQEDQNDAELAFHRLKKKLPEASLVVVVDDYLKRNTAEITDLTMTKAIENFAEARQKRKNRLQTIETGTTLLKAFQRDQKIDRLSSLSPLKSLGWIQGASHKRTQRDRYDLLVNFYTYLRFAKNLAGDPLEGITRPRWTKENPVEFPSLSEAQALLDAAASHVADGVVGAMLPYVAICMFSGMRPDEAKRLDPDWNQVVLENKVILGFRTKVGEQRSVEIHEPLLGILERCKEAGLAPGYWQRVHFRAVQDAFRDPTGEKRKAKDALRTQTASAKKADSSDNHSWVRDYLRHGYATYHFALHGDMNFLVRTMGNSETVLSRSYISRRALKADGEKFFQLQPRWPENFGQRMRPSRPPRPRKPKEEAATPQPS